jgi:glutathione S-transferase
MRLYNSMVSGNCYKVRLICAHLGLALELQELDVVDRSNRMAVIGQLNPALRVPTLVLDDGRPLVESNAILDYLAEGSRYLPSDPYLRAQVLGWQFFEQYEIEPNLAVARFLALFEIDAPEEFRSQRREGGIRGLQALERGLADRDWLVGDAYSVADISLYAYVHVAHEGGFELAAFPATCAWLGRVTAQPGHITITQTPA